MDNKVDSLRKRRREIERQSQQRQRQRKMEQVTNLQDKILKLQEEKNMLQNKNRLLKQETTILKDNVENNQEDTLLIKSKQKQQQWTNKYLQQLDSQVPNLSSSSIGNVKREFISSVYLEFIQSITRSLQNFEKTQNREAQDDIRMELQEIVPFLASYYIRNITNYEERYDMRYDMFMNNDNRDDKQHIRDTRQMLVQVNFSRQQKIEIHDLISLYLIRLRELTQSVRDKISRDVKKIATHKYFQEGDSHKPVVLEILKNSDQLSQLAQMIYGYGSESCLPMYYKIASPEQLAKIYLLSYPQFPNVLLVMLAIYIEIENGSDENFEDNFQDYLINYDYQEYLTQFVREIFKIENDQ